MTLFNFNNGLHACTVTAASPFGGLHRKAGAQYTVWLRNEGLGPGLRWGDEGLIVTDIDLTIPSIHDPFQAKTPQTAIQVRGFRS